MDSRNTNISLLRSMMSEAAVDAYLVSGSDPHQSEYLADYWKGREWLSGFDGSAGLLLITRDHAGLWTDSRYFIQAAKQVKGSGIILHRVQKSLLGSVIDWMGHNLPAESVLGLDGQLFSVREVQLIERRLSVSSIRVRADLDLIRPIWTNRTPLPEAKVFALQKEYTGQTRREKLKVLREQIAGRGIDYYCCTSLDDIAWLFNLRGSDIAYNPVFFAYAVVGRDSCRLFTDSGKMDEGLRAELKADGIQLHPYQEISDFLREGIKFNEIALHKATLNFSLFQMVDPNAVCWTENLIEQTKARKNPTEITNIRRAMVKDGVALTKLVRWLNEELEKRAVSEAEVATQLGFFRSQQDNYFQESFPAIIGYAENGAIVHYRPVEGNSDHIQREGLLLMDSGGQYLEGTTDITRTIAMGNPTQEQKEHFTLVLKGHIALARARFPEGTKGINLDVLARSALWAKGLNYGHGTGHGVGYFLNVHEGPQGISVNPGRADVALQPGMITSNEPGFYREGAYGIRIENLILCKEYQTTDFGDFLEFETLSLFPIDRQLIDVALLNRSELDWLNKYHQMVQARLTPGLDQAEARWLAEQCKPLD